VRIGYIRDRAAARFRRDPRRLDSLKGLRILDIGCGGGILCEPLARLGADLVGIDPSETNIAAAREHAAKSELSIDYRRATAEELAKTRETFDLVLAMEVVEHVVDVPLFVRSCATLVAPQGLMIVATINRTLKSFALAIVGAEYLLRWLPVGSHRWEKFVTPNELDIALAQSGMRVIHEQGVIYNLLADRWQLSTDTDVNYVVTAERSQ
jgi:2-polyprenyl-6-hydroxyphenyl methylase/3-demethylubiquinone-9 3-methyltransferase